MSAHDPDAFWTVERLAQRWSVSPRTVRRLIEGGALMALRIGGQLRVAPDALERFEARQAARARRRMAGLSAPGQSGQVLTGLSGKQ